MGSWMLLLSMLRRKKRHEPHGMLMLVDGPREARSDSENIQNGGAGEAARRPKPRARRVRVKQ
jgi:hypothetical protein